MKKLKNKYLNPQLCQKLVSGSVFSLTHGSLFSGVGGFELGASMSGIETIL